MDIILGKVVVVVVVVAFGSVEVEHLPTLMMPNSRFKSRAREALEYEYDNDDTIYN